MKAHLITRSLSLLGTLAFVLLGTTACKVTSRGPTFGTGEQDGPVRSTRDLGEDTPEAVGMSSDRLARLSETMQGIVAPIDVGFECVRDSRRRSCAVCWKGE